MNTMFDSPSKKKVRSKSGSFTEDDRHACQKNNCDVENTTKRNMAVSQKRSICFYFIFI